MRSCSGDRRSQYTMHAPGHPRPPSLQEAWEEDVALWRLPATSPRAGYYLTAAAARAG